MRYEEGNYKYRMLNVEVKKVDKVDKFTR